MQVGWCTNEDTLRDTPDVEILCEGSNAKGPHYAAIWRQGFLLHFGFEFTPDGMNEFGNSLLFNSIAYIARFEEDRPIVETPGSRKSTWRRSRWMVDRLVECMGEDEDLIASLFSERCLEEARDLGSIVEWYHSQRPYLRGNEDNKLDVDEDVMALDVPFEEREFLETCVENLKGGGAALARTLLGRYAPLGPGSDASAEAWEQYLEENGDYLFFCDSAGYRWVLDPLAKKRGIPSEDLRGEKRATRSPLGGKGVR